MEPNREHPRLGDHEVSGPCSGLGDHKAMGIQRRLHSVVGQETSKLKSMPRLPAKGKVGLPRPKRRQDSCTEPRLSESLQLEKIKLFLPPFPDLLALLLGPAQAFRGWDLAQLLGCVTLFLLRTTGA